MANRRSGLLAAVGALVLSVSAASAASSRAPEPEPAAPKDAVFASTASAELAEPRTVDVGQALTHSQSRTQDRRQVASPTRAASVAASAVGAQDIPFAALYAYETAAAALKKADPDCGLEWSLLAAIGRVESNHGRYGGADLGDDGVSTPLIRGVALNGKGPVKAIRDTDAGRLDGDKRWDRAVGPMQFLPSTWVYSGVDADGDGVRSPDDLDDAALAAGVYLCSGAGGLDTAEGLRSAVLRYNQSDSYADTVIALAKAYAAGDYTSSTPYTPTTSAALETPPADPGTDKGGRPGTKDGKPKPGGKDGKGSKDGKPGKGGQDDKGGKPAKPTKPTKPTKPNEPNGPSEPAEPTDPVEPNDPNDPTEPAEPTEPPTPSEPPKPNEPTEPPGPVLVEVSGVLADCDGSTPAPGEPVSAFCVGGTALAVGDAAVLAQPALADHDGDGTVETNGAELAGLLGGEVVLVVEKGTAPLVVRAVNGADYATPRD